MGFNDLTRMLKKKTYVILCSGLRSLFGLLFLAACLFVVFVDVVCCVCLLFVVVVCFCLKAFVVRTRGLQSFYAGCH